MSEQQPCCHYTSISYVNQQPGYCSETIPVVALSSSVYEPCGHHPQPDMKLDFLGLYIENVLNGRPLSSPLVGSIPSCVQGNFVEADAMGKRDFLEAVLLLV